MASNQAQATAVHWQMTTDADNLVWLTLDRNKASVNSLSHDVLEELKIILAQLHQKTPAGLVIRSGKENGFIYGADINEFTELNDVDETMILIRRGQHIMDLIESLTCPTLALINGVCMGGGTELALACDYRIATSDARIGLPEIKLGIHPGFGGVARSIPLLGAPAAMNLMLTGRTILASAARRIGLVDEVVATRLMESAARDFIISKPPRTKAKWYLQLTSHPFARPLLARYLRKQVSKNAQKDHYPAPFKLIDLWMQNGNDKDAVLDAEVLSVSQLMMTQTSRNLVRVFLLQERLKSFGKSPDTNKKFQHVHVIGAGIMGGDIAAWCSSRNLRVTLQETRNDAVGSMLQRAGRLFNKCIRQKNLVTTAFDNIIPDPAGDGAAKADVVIEAIYENIDAKNELLKAVEPVIKPHALLATNTSSLMLEQLDTVMSEPGRLVGLHFFNPVDQMPLVEIVNGQHTSQAVINQAASFALYLGKIPLPVKSAPGFLVNRILMPYLLEAMILIEEGFSLPDIDQGAINYGMPMGPVTLADTVGLDICLAVARNLSNKLRCAVPQQLIEMVDAGKLGKKSGSGFYNWKNGKISDPDSSSNTIPPEIEERLILRLLNESVSCLNEEIVDDADLLDAGVILGTGFAPFRGGPITYINATGIEKIYSKLQQLERKHGDRFTADPGWVKLRMQAGG